MTETALLQRLLIRASELGWRLFRNQVGKYQLADGRWISSGLVGSSDLIGWMPHRITPADVGRTFAVFVAVEAKVGRRALTEAQVNFLRAVRDAGGLALTARSVDDLEDYPYANF